MYRKFRVTLFFIFSTLICISEGTAQRKSKDDGIDLLQARPKLVVGIVVDQMRYDYITRFYSHFGDDGFKRFIEEGFNCKNNHYNYAPTSTGPGHTSVYTGTTPATHGVIGNNWYDKESGEDVYCAGDDTYTSVGTSSDAGKMSPHRISVTTITDELRLHTQMRGKTIAIALKDRGAVLPGGHTANAAYWFHGADEGNWISSSYYMNTLPKWVDDFNTSRKVEEYKKPWTTLKNIDDYVESTSDDNKYEGLFDAESKPTFPHSPPSLLDKRANFDVIKSTPYGNSLTADFALAAIEGEDLGSDAFTDFLAISFSSTDYVGHKFGVSSKEVEDTYLRLDQDLERLFKALDKKVGENEYTVFLTADHAAIEVPAYLKDLRIPASNLKWNANEAKFKQFLEFTYGTTDIVKNFSNFQYFLDYDVIKNLGLNLQEVQETLALELLDYEGVDRTYTASQLWQNNYTHGIPYILQNGYNQKRSGDVMIVLQPGTTTSGMTGSTHGSPQVYDTHVPLLFYGKGIKKGSTVERTEIVDAAPTIAVLLGISFPNGTTGRPVTKALE